MSEPRHSFHDRLEDIRTDIVKLAALVTESLPRATEALLSGDLDAARAVIANDDAVDDLSLAIEERCLALLATQQPMAGDLRALVTAIRLVSEIERSGDLTANVAKRTSRIQGLRVDHRARGLIERMSEEAHRLFCLAVDSYVDGDADMADSIDDLDDALDMVHSEFIAAVLEACRGDRMDVQAAVQLALVGRFYERIGDHAVNIGHRVGYMVSGHLPEHEHDAPPPGVRDRAPMREARGGG
jgi:phosphate transport system protein